MGGPFLLSTAHCLLPTPVNLRMPAGITLEVLLVLAAFFLLLCVVASKISAKLGIPALLLFLCIGMLAGSDGPGGIEFTDLALTKSLGTLALAFILFAGGLETNWQAIRPIALKGLALSTIGVVVTCISVGAFVHYVLKFPPLPSLLLGAVVSSTDAAAIFGVLKSSGIRLKHNITELLEFESGTNDPVAIFLTITLTSMITEPGFSATTIIPRLLLEMPLGAVIGWLGAKGAVWLINRIRLEYDGLYPVITLATVCLVFGGSAWIHGNPFLAVYVAGISMGSQNFLHRLALTQFHDAMAWITQIGVFLLLGLLVFPSQLPSVAFSGVLLSLFLIFVARPVAVFASLALSKMQKRTKLFIAWAGLRGAVPIILATFPALAGVNEATEIFNLVFFVVLTSVLIQGTTLRPLAKLLSVSRPASSTSGMKPASGGDLLEITLVEGSKAVGLQVVELGLPPTALIVLLTRAGSQYVPQGSTVLQIGDRILVATRRSDHKELRDRFI